MQLHGKTEAIPDGVGALSKLEILSLDGNRITELPDAMASGAALIVVHLNQNRLRTLPEWLANLPALAHLNVRGNPELTEVPAVLERERKAWLPQLRARGKGLSRTGGWPTLEMDEAWMRCLGAPTLARLREVGARTPALLVPEHRAELDAIRERVGDAVLSEIDAALLAGLPIPESVRSAVRSAGLGTQVFFIATAPCMFLAADGRSDAYERAWIRDRPAQPRSRAEGEVSPDSMPARALSSLKEVVDRPPPRELGDVDGALDRLTPAQREKVSTAWNVQRDKLGGWPSWLQDVAHPRCPECEQPMVRLVFQVDSDGHSARRPGSARRAPGAITHAGGAARPHGTPPCTAAHACPGAG